MKQLFITLRDLINAINGVKWVDKDNGQIDNYEENPPVDFPCVLIKMAFPNFESLGGGAQIGTGTVTIRCITNLAINETATGASPDAVDRSFNYYDIGTDIFNLLQGYTDGMIKNFDRISEGDETRKDQLSVYKMVFSCSFLQIANN